MELKIIYQRIIFLIFCISMLLFFILGAMYPVETNFWLVSNGVPILIIEFISIFSISLLLVITNKKAEEHLNIQMSGIFGSIVSKKTGYIFFLICVFIMAFSFLFIYSIWILLYFLISHLVKYFAFKQSSTTEETNRAINAWGGATVSIILSALISFFLSSYTYSIFAEQITLMNEYHQEILSNSGVTGSASFEVFIMWGILYFIMLIFFDWFAPIWEKKQVNHSLELLIKKMQGKRFI
jgi:hypothetical protein